MWLTSTTAALGHKRRGAFVRFRSRADLPAAEDGEKVPIAEKVQSSAVGGVCRVATHRDWISVAA
jgi:hypothetical protein